MLDHFYFTLRFSKAIFLVFFAFSLLNHSAKANLDGELSVNRKDLRDEKSNFSGLLLLVSGQVIILEYFTVPVKSIY